MVVMVRRRSTVRFRKGAPRSWRFFDYVSGEHVVRKFPPSAPRPGHRDTDYGGDLGELRAPSRLMSVSGFWRSRSVQPLVSERLKLPQGDSRAQPFRTGLGTGRRAGGSSYGLDGTILGLPGGPVHLEIVR